MIELPPPPALIPRARVRCEVDVIASLGAAPRGERRYVPLRGGVEGPELHARHRRRSSTPAVADFPGVYADPP